MKKIHFQKKVSGSLAYIVASSVETIVAGIEQSSLNA
jgi:hypothetical protein